MHLRFAVAFNATTLVSGSVTGKKNNKKTLPKLKCADKKLLEESCVRNFRNPLFAKLLLFEIFRTFPEIILGKNIRCSKFKAFTVEIFH